MNLFLAEIADASTSKNICENKLEYIDSVMNFIQRNHSSDLTVDGLGRQFSISRSQLYRLFKEHVGLSPQQYIINVRIEAAKTFLSSSDFSMKRIAQECGFRDSMHFSAVFKSNTSLSPTQYRIQNQLFK